MKKTIIILSAIFAVFILSYLIMFLRKVKPMKNYIITSKFTDDLNGIVLSCEYGENLYSVTSGIVCEIGENETAGRYLSIYSKLHKIKFRYSHLSNITCKLNEKVLAGDLIGFAGNTGQTTGTCLYLEMQKNEKPENPENFISL